jgi:hypothetical protein
MKIKIRQRVKHEEAPERREAERTKIRPLAARIFAKFCASAASKDREADARPHILHVAAHG